MHGAFYENHCQGCAAQLTCLAEFQHGCRERSRNLPFPHINVRLSAPDLFVERSVRSAWRTAEGVGDLLMTDAADRQVLLGRWSQSRRVDAAGWGKSRIATVKRPLNHLRALQTRNFVRDDFALYGIISVEYNKSYYGRTREWGRRPLSYASCKSTLLGVTVCYPRTHLLVAVTRSGVGESSMPPWTCRTAQHMSNPRHTQDLPVGVCELYANEHNYW